MCTRRMNTPSEHGLEGSMPRRLSSASTATSSVITSYSIHYTKLYDEGVEVYVDPKSALFVDGTQIDYHESLMGSGFAFSNPNATGTCGCGTSFTA